MELNAKSVAASSSTARPTSSTSMLRFPALAIGCDRAQAASCCDPGSRNTDVREPAAESYWAAARF